MSEVSLFVPGFLSQGTRNKDADPYKLLPTKPGVGRVALETPDAHVIPVFAIGCCILSLHAVSLHDV